MKLVLNGVVIMNSNVFHELEDRVCAWFSVYESALRSGKPLDDYVEQGCYLCCGRPVFCDAYIPSYKVERKSSFMELI